MGITNIEATISNIKSPSKKVTDEYLVDTGAGYTVVPHAAVKKLGLKPTRTQKFSLADGTTVERSLGYAMVKIDGSEAPSTVVLGEKGDSALLGAITLENMGLMIDPFKRKLLPMRLMLA